MPRKSSIALLDPPKKGKYDGAFKAKAGSRDSDSENPVEKFGAPRILMDSASTINWATPASTVLYAGQNVHWTTQSDTHYTAGHTVASVASGAAAFFTHSGGIQALSLTARANGTLLK